MRPKFIGLIIIGLGVIFLSSLALFGHQALVVKSKPLVQTENYLPQEVSTFVLIFDFDNGAITSSTLSYETDQSLFEALKKTSLQIKTENYPLLGAIVKNINGFENNTDGKYWQYWINGRYAEIGISSYIVKPSDLIEWKFIK